MGNKTIIGALLAVLAIGGLLWLGRSVNQNGAKPRVTAVEAMSTLTSAESSFDFGRISMQDGLVEKGFEVTNSGGSDILLERLTTSCMCTVAYITTADGKEKGPFGMVGHGGTVPKANELIRAGETRIVRVVFDPNAHGPAGVGQIERLIMLEDSNGGRLDFGFKAIVTP